MEREHGDYKSDRDIELISKLAGCLTVENYCKWYDLYYIMTKVEFCKYFRAIFLHPELNQELYDIVNATNVEHMDEEFSLSLYNKYHIVKFSKIKPQYLSEVEFWDDSWEPKSLIDFLIKHHIKLGSESYKAIVIRWCQSHEITCVKDDQLPSYEDYNKVLIDDAGDISNCAYEYDNNFWENPNFRLWRE